jgi:hypothetical protein
MMKQLLTMLMLAIGIGTVALSVTGKHGQGIDWQLLNLTAQQDIQAQIINKEYQDNFQILRKQELDAEVKEQSLLQLRKEMLVGMKKILTDEQKKIAIDVIANEMEGRINKRLDWVVDDLILTSDQQENLKQALTEKFNELQGLLLVRAIPDFNDRQQMFDQLDEVLPGILSSEQSKLWQQIKFKRQLYLQAEKGTESSVSYFSV